MATATIDGLSPEAPDVAVAQPNLRRSVVLSFAIFLLIGVAESAIHVLLGPSATRTPTWSSELRGNMPWWLLWVVFMPAVFVLARRYQFHGPSRLKSALAHAGLGLVIATAHGVTFAVTFHAFTGKVLAPTFAGQVRWFVYGYLLMDLITYAACVGIYWSVEYFSQYQASALAAARSDAHAAKLQLRLADARIHALRMELNPHFLFNALNSVSGLVRKGEQASAVEMLARLGELMRTTLNRDMPPEVPLAEEVALLLRFLDIEMVRFGDRLRVGWDVGADVWQAMVPPLILQPLVENALRHGISRRSGAGLLHISARRSGLQLELVVQDSGEGVQKAARPVGAGIGLTNTRARLEELYGTEGASLDLSNVASGGARARILLPLHLSRTEPDAVALN